MPSEMQKKVLNHLRDLTKAHGNELVFQPDWGNTGKAFVQEEGKFKTHLWLSYNFQSGYCSIDIYRGTENPHAVKQRAAGSSYILYSDDNSMNEMFDGFETLLKEVPT